MIPLSCQCFSQLMGFQISPVKCGWGHNKWRSGLTPGAELMIKNRRVPCVLFLDKKLQVQSPSFFPVC